MIIEKSYYVAPDTKRGNDKAYSLLVKILSDTKKIAIGKIVLRDKENIVSLRPYQRGMVMHILRYLDEIRPTAHYYDRELDSSVRMNDFKSFHSQSHYQDSIVS